MAKDGKQNRRSGDPVLTWFVLSKLICKEATVAELQERYSKYAKGKVLDVYDLKRRWLVDFHRVFYMHNKERKGDLSEGEHLLHVLQRRASKWVIRLNEDCKQKMMISCPVQDVREEIIQNGRVEGFRIIFN